MYLEVGGIVMVVEGFERALGKAKVAAWGAGRVNEGRWEVWVRGMSGFCRSGCGGSRRVVLGDETIVFGRHMGLECSHGCLSWTSTRLQLAVKLG